MFSLLRQINARHSVHCNRFTRFCMIAVVLILVGLSAASMLSGQSAARDPGIRIGFLPTESALPGLTFAELGLFNSAKDVFTEIASVSGTFPGESGSGLGPSFNMNSCAGCHAYPAIGGSSPPLNPQVAVANLHGATNQLPSFITASGPVLEARFRTNPDGSPDGGVHDLFVTSGRSDAQTGCLQHQTDFAPQLASKNVVFRIPTPTFGAGFIEAITDDTILTNLSANAAAKTAFGITGHVNRTGNDGSITRFGWKAQNKSLLVFAGEAYNVEMGVTNELFPNPRETSIACDTLGHPEDSTHVSGSPADIVNFALFSRLLDAPHPVESYNNATAASIQNGHTIFGQVGCVLCHTDSLLTGRSSIFALSNKQAALFSDLAVHNMGTGLADGIAQGSATGNEFRTAPLWGLGRRIFLLHDGRTTDLIQAIKAHEGSGSEANDSIRAFGLLSNSNLQDLLNFLRSL